MKRDNLRQQKHKRGRGKDETYKENEDKMVVADKRLFCP